MQSEYIADFLHRGGRGKWYIDGGKMDNDTRTKLRNALAGLLGIKQLDVPTFDAKVITADIDKGQGILDKNKEDRKKLLELQKVLNSTYHTLDAAFKKYNSLKIKWDKIPKDADIKTNNTLPSIDTINALLTIYKTRISEETEGKLLGRINELNKKIKTGADNLDNTNFTTLTTNVDDHVKGLKLDELEKKINNYFKPSDTTKIEGSILEKFNALIDALSKLTTPFVNFEAITYDLRQMGKNINASKGSINNITTQIKNIKDILEAICGTDCTTIEKQITTTIEALDAFNRENGANDKLLTGEANYKTPRAIIYKLAEFKRGISRKINITYNLGIISKQNLIKLGFNADNAEIIDNNLDELTKLDKKLPIDDTIKQYKIDLSSP